MDATIRMCFWPAVVFTMSVIFVCRHWMKLRKLTDNLFLCLAFSGPQTSDYQILV